MNMAAKIQSEILKGREHRERERERNKKERKKDPDVKWRTTVMWMLKFKV
jgi:hypothetical protein